MNWSGHPSRIGIRKNSIELLVKPVNTLIKLLKRVSSSQLFCHFSMFFVDGIILSVSNLIVIFKLKSAEIIGLMAF